MQNSNLKNKRLLRFLQTFSQLFTAFTVGCAILYLMETNPITSKILLTANNEYSETGMFIISLVSTAGSFYFIFARKRVKGMLIYPTLISFGIFVALVISVFTKGHDFESAQHLMLGSICGIVGAAMICSILNPLPMDQVTTKNLYKHKILIEF